MGMLDCCKKRETSIRVHVLVCIFGIGSWIAVNGLWVELPILVQHLPEAWNLGSYLVIIIQVANIGPLLFTVATTLAPGKVNEKLVVYIIVVIGIASCLLLSFFWDRTSMIAGTEHSTALLVLQFFLALVDCTSSVVFLPFMSLFKPQYITTFFIGEGLSGLLPSLLAIGQGAGAVRCLNQTNVTGVTIASAISVFDDTVSQDASSYSIQVEYLEPNFPVQDFFLFLFAMMVACGLAFALLNHLPMCKKEQVGSPKLTTEVDVAGSSMSRVMETDKRLDKVSEVYNTDAHSRDTSFVGGTTNAACANSSSPLLGSRCQHKHGKGTLTFEDGVTTKTSQGNVSMELTTRSFSPLCTSTYVYLFLLTAWINALGNGVLPSIQSYSSLPYGMDCYHWAVTLASIANPVACFVSFFLPMPSNAAITGLTVIGSGIAAYLLLIATLSPTPYLVGEATGAAIVIGAFVLTTLCLTYAKVSIATMFRMHGRKALLWCGAMTQVGSTVGAITMFVLINVLNLLKSAPMCPS